jgi:DNA invertase Pin-like site-specific DNA recombinase
VRGQSVSSYAARVKGKVVRYGIYAREPSLVRSPLDRASAQEQVCKRHLALHKEALSQCMHAATYVDVGFTAGAPARPSLQRLLADIDAGKIALIVIAGAWNILAGSTVELEAIFAILEAQRVPILSATGLIDPSSDAGKRPLDIVRSLAALEAQQADSWSGL